MPILVEANDLKIGRYWLRRKTHDVMYLSKHCGFFQLRLDPKNEEH